MSALDRAWELFFELAPEPVPRIGNSGWDFSGYNWAVDPEEVWAVTDQVEYLTGVPVDRLVRASLHRRIIELRNYRDFDSRARRIAQLEPLCEKLGTRQRDARRRKLERESRQRYRRRPKR